MNLRLRRPGRFPIACALLLSGACAGNPAPGEPGYPYNLQGRYDVVFSVQGMDYTGTAELGTVRGGAVTGEIRLEYPEPITADLNGTVADSTFRFESVYTRSGDCDGALLGTGAIRPEGTGSSGDVEVIDDCVGGVMEGGFELTRP